ncbi:MAG: AraC family transcriptional regulator, partial [Verrucomicrobiota bacterium]|nr:AraC family transcriptional regulator [Verrucomicrobiota bacterium]
MLETPQIIRTEPRLTAFIHLTIPRDEIQDVIGPGLSEVRAALEAQGIAAAGPWLTHHLKMAPDVFDFEITVPVTRPIV